ncbi:MAG: riboflavin synthase [Myxococcales bacterium]|nr:riboflavin synthase [Myxococcales bacterium]
MFTGIVETVGEVISAVPRGDGCRLQVWAPGVVEGVSLGDSIAVDGACLTVCDLVGDEVSFEAVRETLDCTAVGSLVKGSKVNLERAMRADGRFDGHIVQGHVDGVGRVVDLKRKANDVELHIECSRELAGLLVNKGSVTVHGVSLTVVEAGEAGFHVALIPHTLEVTTLGGLAKEDPVNLEADILGKYISRYLARIAPEVK